MSLAPVYKRFKVEIDIDSGPAFVAGVGKLYLSFDEGYGVAAVVQLWKLHFQLVLWRLGKK